MSCPDCFRGSERTDATPTGQVITLHGLPTYTANPSTGKIPKGIVVIIPDAFGWEFVNNRLLVDEYARKGDFTVFMPDFMNGKSFCFPSDLLLLLLHHSLVNVASIHGMVFYAWNTFREIALCRAM